MTKTDYKTDFQTPPYVCEYMASLIPAGAKKVLEPTPGIGNLISVLHGYDITAPKNFFDLDPELKFDCIIGNPPFSSKYAFGVPPDFDRHGMRLGYHILTECMEKYDNIIMLMPWFTISDSDVRLRNLKRYGMKSLTALPRKTFQYARIQTVVIELVKGWQHHTIFKVFDLLK